MKYFEGFRLVIICPFQELALFRLLAGVVFWRLTRSLSSTVTFILVSAQWKLFNYGIQYQVNCIQNLYVNFNIKEFWEQRN